MKGDNLLAVCDDKALSIIDIEKSSVEKYTVGNNNLTRLFKLALPEESYNAFAGT